MGKLLGIAVILGAAYVYVSQNSGMAQRLHLSHAASSGYTPTMAQSIGASAVGLAGRIGN